MSKNTLKVATIEIEGTRPLLFHAFNLSALSLERKPRTGAAGNDPIEWKNTVLVHDGVKLYLTGNHFFSCFKSAAIFTKVGRGTIQKKVVATMQVLDDIVYITNRELPKNIDDLTNEDLIDESTPPNKPVYLDVRGVINPNSKGRNARYRVACSPGWSCTVKVLWDSSIVSSEQMKQVFIDAGTLVGIGDGRSIGMGTFFVKDVLIQDYQI